MSKLACLGLLLAACATTQSSTIDPDRAAPRARVQLDLVPVPGARPVFPTAIDPALPSIDRLGHVVRAALGDTATAELELCVSAAGTVTRVALARSSRLAAFDQALLRDAARWRFTTLPGPASLQTCRRATIAYQAH